jgi:serine/threonine-protein kinase RsbW
MRNRSGNPLLARVRRDRFIGRDAELERLYLRAVSGGDVPAIHLIGGPGTGVSELLRQLYDQLFSEQRFVVPFYFSIDPKDATAYAAATRFQYQFLLQTIAFRRNEPELLSSMPDICELAKLAPLQDAEWVNRMCEACEMKSPLNDERAYIRAALNAPNRAASSARMQVGVIIDDLHNVDLLENGNVILNEVSTLNKRSGVLLITGSRTSFTDVSRSALRMSLPKLDRRSVGKVVTRSVDETGIRIGPEATDLIASQFDGDLKLVEIFMNAAASKHSDLESFRDVQKMYTEDLMKGGIASHFDEIFNGVIDPLSIQRLFDELFYAIGERGTLFSLPALREKLDLSNERFQRLVKILRTENVLEISGSDAQISDNDVIRDLIIARHRSAARLTSPAAAAALTISNALKRSPVLMSRVYRREAASGLEDILSAFDLQSVSSLWIDYGRFRDELKGLSQDEMRSKLSTSPADVVLPQIAFAAPIVDYLREFGLEPEPERAILGVGFADKSYREEDAVSWFAVEIDSKLESDAALTQQICDRIDKAAAELGYSNYRIWLVSPEGFSSGALDLLRERNGFGSSRRQVDMLREFLFGEAADETNATEYEMVIPIGEETEIIAAHAFEEIARRIELPAKTVNQIKTALIEACINAAEHSLSPDRKIHQKFAIDDKKIVITVSNRGLRLADRVAEQSPTPANEGRRGWGLGLMRQLMDDVRVESVDDGTRIVMTKYR